MIRKLLPYFWVCFLLLWPWLSGAQIVKYDLAFRHWGQYYAPWQDWRWWKAQGTAESNLNQAARGSCGEIGIMQLLPATARALGVDPFDSEANIQGGIKYDLQLYQAWKASSDSSDRRSLMFASYNAGLGNIQRAVKIEGSTVWWIVARGLSVVTGAHAQTTIRYVSGINSIYRGIP